MAKEAEVEALIRHTISAHGRLDVFLNNAARYVFADALEVTEEGESVCLLPSVWFKAFLKTGWCLVSRRGKPLQICHPLTFV